MIRALLGIVLVTSLAQGSDRSLHRSRREMLRTTPRARAPQLAINLNRTLSRTQRPTPRVRLRPSFFQTRSRQPSFLPITPRYRFPTVQAPLRTVGPPISLAGNALSTLLPQLLANTNNLLPLLPRTSAEEKPQNNFPPFDPNLFNSASNSPSPSPPLPFTPQTPPNFGGASPSGGGGGPGGGSGGGGSPNGSGGGSPDNNDNSDQFDPRREALRDALLDRLRRDRDDDDEDDDDFFEPEHDIVEEDDDLGDDGFPSSPLISDRPPISSSPPGGPRGRIGGPSPGIPFPSGSPSPRSPAGRLDGGIGNGGTTGGATSGDTGGATGGSVRAGGVGSGRPQPTPSSTPRNFRSRPARPIPPGSNLPEKSDYEFPVKLPTSPAFKSAIGKCVKCHQSQDVTRYLKNPESLGYHLATMNDHLFNEMATRAGLTPEERQALHGFVSKSRDEVDARTALLPDGEPPACYMNRVEQATRTQAFPEVESGSSFMASALHGAKGGRKMMFYDRRTVPRMWLNNDFKDDGVHYPERFLTPDRPTAPKDRIDQMGYHSDAGREHPWIHSAGTDISPNVESEKFFLTSPSGKLGSLVTRTKQSHPHYFNTSTNLLGPEHGWVYEPGTTFGEVMKVKDPETGKSFAFEIRTRHKLPSGEWTMDVLRPFANPQELAEGIRRVCTNASPPAGCEQMGSIMARLEPPSVRVASRTEFINSRTFKTPRDPLTLSSTANEGTQPTTSLHELPDIPPAIVRELLQSTPFKSVKNQPWIPAEGGKPAGWAANAKGFNIFPKNNFISFIPLTDTGCMKCHDSAGRQVNNFDPDPSQMKAPAPGDAQLVRTWYNRVPGDDHILSFHPFDKNAVKRGLPVGEGSLNRCLTQHGLF